LSRVLARFQREDGQALAEYGLILALIAVVAIAALGVLGAAIFGVLDDIAACFPGSTGGGTCPT
jgi:pilus assembly protein Flp/PilA